MRITSEADYAVRIVYCLAGLNEGERIGAKEISRRSNVTPSFCLKILRKLVMAGIARSYKGADGGYALAVSPREVTVRAVIETIDGEILLNKCLEESACAHSSRCSCKFRTIWAELSRKVADSLEEENFGDLLKR